MALATSTPQGTPSVRMVLNKGFDQGGFVFFTNYGSRKGAELDANPRAALLFHWPELGRQVRIEGAVARVPRAESEAYPAVDLARPAEARATALSAALGENNPFAGERFLNRARCEDEII